MPSIFFILPPPRVRPHPFTQYLLIMSDFRKKGVNEKWDSKKGQKKKHPINRVPLFQQKLNYCSNCSTISLVLSTFSAKVFLVPTGTIL